MRHRDMLETCWAVTLAETLSEYNVNSAFASRPVDELHGAHIYAAATILGWKWATAN
jgi:hypothetical protein